MREFQVIERLSAQEEKELQECEAGLKETLSAFWDATGFLSRIRNKKLYRKTHKTFKDYCSEKWDISASRARQLTDSLDVLDGLPVPIAKLITNERQTRALSQVPEPYRQKVVLEAKKNGPITAQSLIDAAKSVTMVTLPQPVKMGKSENGTAKTEPPKVLDSMGLPVPKNALVFWERRGEINALMTEASRLKCKVEELMATKDDDPMYRHLDQQTITHLEHARYCISTILPHAVCLKCQGVLDVLVDKWCDVCKGTGLMSKEQYKGYPYPQVKAMREKQISLKSK